MDKSKRYRLIRPHLDESEKIEDDFSKAISAFQAIVSAF